MKKILLIGLSAFLACENSDAMNGLQRVQLEQQQALQCEQEILQYEQKGQRGPLRLRAALKVLQESIQQVQQREKHVRQL